MPPLQTDSTKPPVVGTPTYAGDSKRVMFAIFTALGTIGTVAAVLGNLNPKIQIVAGICTAICAGINQYYDFKATGPVTTQRL